MNTLKIDYDKKIQCPECGELFYPESGCECGISYIDYIEIMNNDNEQIW